MATFTKLILLFVCTLFSESALCYLEFRGNIGFHNNEYIFNSSQNTITEDYSLDLKSYNMDLVLYLWRLGLGVRHGKLGTSLNETSSFGFASTSNDIILDAELTMAMLSLRLGEKTVEGVDGSSTIFGELIFAKKIAGTARIYFGESGTPKTYFSDNSEAYSVSALGGVNLNGLLFGMELGALKHTLTELKTNNGIPFGQDITLSTVFVMLHIGYDF